ncbi:MAG: glycosyltransferase [Anaerolineae bacterium]|nr:glycosyltransferase [Candidatus Roseilinea sp.]MDW8448988.1 glycosyltransferase [Anaerolineae bacterium]
MVQHPEVLVSVIIPCYNAGRWLRKSIASALAQTHRPIEVIVVDDGSTDDSVNILRSYGDRIRFVQQPHVNGNHARNVGMSLSRGEYLQFLDADDYLLPEKVAAQVALLEATGADAAYCDYAFLTHPDGAPRLGQFRTTGIQPDLLTALLQGRWIPPHALLWRREVIEALGGWDETFFAAQDYELMLRAALQGLQLRYQPGHWAVVRRYGNVTVSTSDPLRRLWHRTRALEKVEHRLAQDEALRKRYAPELARAYFRTARELYPLDRRAAVQLCARSLSLDPAFAPRRSLAYDAAFGLLGFERTEALVQVWRGLKRALGKIKAWWSESRRRRLSGC